MLTQWPLPGYSRLEEMRPWQFIGWNKPIANTISEPESSTVIALSSAPSSRPPRLPLCWRRRTATAIRVSPYAAVTGSVSGPSGFAPPIPPSATSAPRAARGTRKSISSRAGHPRSEAGPSRRYTEEPGFLPTASNGFRLSSSRSLGVLQRGWQVLRTGSEKCAYSRRHSMSWCFALCYPAKMRRWFVGTAAAAFCTAEPCCWGASSSHRGPRALKTVPLVPGLTTNPAS